METNKKIIIAVLIGVIIILSGAVLGTFLKEPVKTVELFENGTTIEVPADTNLTNKDEFSTTYLTGKNTTIIGIDNNNLVGALASRLVSEVIVTNGEKQDNGLYKFDKNSIMKIADQLGREYNADNVKDNVYINIKNNNTVNQTVIIIGIDEKEILSISDSIHWKLSNGNNINSTNTTVNSTVDTAGAADNEKTYPFYSDDGTLVGYYHVGDTIDFKGYILKLQPDGSWATIGESTGSSEEAYNAGYDSAVDDMSDDGGSSSSDSSHKSDRSDKKSSGGGSSDKKSR